MNTSRVAAQLWTVRSHTQTPQDFAPAMKRIYNIGYRAVQVAGLGPIPEKDIASVLDGEGLTCMGAHIKPSMILNEPNRVVDKLKELNCTMAAYPYPDGVDFSSLKGVRDLARKLNRAGRVLHEAGLDLAYHNHSIEFQRLGGKPILEWIYQSTDPRYLKAELDTYWIQHGGGDPAAWCKKMSGRMKDVHIKDYAIASDGKTPVFAEIGSGNLNWPAILDACERAHVRWYVVEQDDCYGRDPFDSLKKSFEFLKTQCRE